MNHQWKAIKYGVLLFALPLVATAAASAHQWMVESNPISIKNPSVATANSAIGMERVHTVALNRHGAIEGRIASIEAGSKNTKGIAKLKIYFVQNGIVVKESYTQTDGSFVVQGVPEGVYSFVATGQDGFAAYGVRVVTDTTGKYDNVMEIAAVSQGIDVVKRIINEGLTNVVSDVAGEKSGASADDFEGANQVKLIDGTLHGRVSTMGGNSDSVGQTMIHILNRNSKVAEVQADDSGAFEIPGLEPGVYEFVAVGPSGVAVLAFEAVTTVNVSAVGLVDAAANPVSIELESATEPVGFSPAIPNYAASFNVFLIDPQDVEPTPAQDGSADDDDDNVPPIEFSSQSGALGGAQGGPAGSVGTFPELSAAPVGGGAAAQVGGGRLVQLGLVGGIIALGITNGDPVDVSNNNPN